MPNPRETYVPLNVNGGADTDIVLTMMARYVEVLEDVAPGSPNAGVAQGIVGNLVDPVDGTLTPPAVDGGYWKQDTPEAVPQVLFALGDPRAIHGGLGVPVGGKGAIVAKLKSATATATQVIVKEYY